MIWKEREEKGQWVGSLVVGRERRRERKSMRDSGQGLVVYRARRRKREERVREIRGFE